MTPCPLPAARNNSLTCIKRAVSRHHAVTLDPPVGSSSSSSLCFHASSRQGRGERLFSPLVPGRRRLPGAHSRHPSPPPPRPRSREGCPGSLAARPILSKQSKTLCPYAVPEPRPKSAQRLAFYLLKKDNVEILTLADSVREIRNDITFCDQCHNMAETNPCSVCAGDVRRRLID